MTVLPDDGLSLAAEFPDATHEQWQRLVEGVLRKSGKEVSGAAAEEALSTALEDGLATRPLYTAHDAAPDPGFPGFAPFVRGGRRRGQHRRRLGRTAAAHGAPTATRCSPTWRTASPRCGWPSARAASRCRRSAGSSTASTSTWRPSSWTPGAEVEPAARELLRLYEERGVAEEAARGNLGADPLGHEARTGQAYDFAPVAALARLCAEEYPGLRALTVDALPYHEAGGSAAQELGCLAGDRRRLSAGADRGRAERRTGLCAAGVPVRGHRRPVPDDRQAAGRAPAVGPGRRGVRGAAARGAAAARGDLAGDDDAPRPVGEHAAHDRRHAGRRGRAAPTPSPCCPSTTRSGLPDAFARRIARNTSTILHRGVASGPGDRPGGRLLVRGAAHRRTRPRGLGVLPGDRAGGRPGGRPALRAGRRATWPPPGRRAARSSPSGANPITGVSEFPHLAEQPVGPRARARAAVRRAAPGAARRGVRGAARPLRRPPRRDRLPAADLPGRPRPGRRAHRPHDLRREPLPGGRHRARHRGHLRGAAAPPRSACAPATRCTRSRPRAWPRS